MNHPGPTTHENSIFAGPGIGHPSAEGNFIPRRYGLSSPPLEGWRLADGVVRECVISHLVPFVIARIKKHCGRMPADINDLDPVVKPRDDSGWIIPPCGGRRIML